MHDLLLLPALQVAADVPVGAIRVSAAGVLARLRTAIDRSVSPPDDGDAAASLADALGTCRHDRLESFAQRVVARPEVRAATDAEAEVDHDALPPLFYLCAAEAVADGEIAEASVGLVALLGDPATRSQALLGLAVCAARMERPEEAIAMALGSRNEGATHPRAFFVAGFAEHLRGHARQARLYLALASRLARSEVGYEHDLRLAQRFLLSMQLA